MTKWQEVFKFPAGAKFPEPPAAFLVNVLCQVKLAIKCDRASKVRSSSDWLWRSADIRCQPARLGTSKHPGHLAALRRSCERARASSPSGPSASWCGSSTPPTTPTCSTPGRSPPQPPSAFGPSSYQWLSSAPGEPSAAVVAAPSTAGDVPDRLLEPNDSGPCIHPRTATSSAFDTQPVPAVACLGQEVASVDLLRSHRPHPGHHRHPLRHLVRLLDAHRMARLAPSQHPRRQRRHAGEISKLPRASADAR